MNGLGGIAVEAEGRTARPQAEYSWGRRPLSFLQELANKTQRSAVFSASVSYGLGYM